MKAAHRRPLAANKFNNAIQQSTISLTSLRSGVGDPPKVNVIPSVAEATLDCRVLPGTTRDEWIAELRAPARRDPTIKIEVDQRRDGSGRHARRTRRSTARSRQR